ncbi:hypothetical protein DACRYDRAFT_114191 [Dacryopinax primogenitus]|uniref:GTP-binding protein n=1 Tax=Dacryopinax primogenitus (strain DJM 731) TaxID=1858805 RepID=M5G7Y2_DACPD|nr:uncharacterized protein DACRYDRAFT_114191 [Dacryopinax primogenitus]EJU04869.1 hypothetical protein DACRYDRAFT_114191 [Dacryopinax primogenitus]
MFLWRRAFPHSSSSSSSTPLPSSKPKPTPAPPAAAAAASLPPTPTAQIPPLPDPWRKRILIMGLRRSGKTTAREVVFHRLPLNRAFFVDTTLDVVKEDVECVHLPLPAYNFSHVLLFLLLVTVLVLALALAFHRFWIPLQLWEIPGSQSLDILPLHSSHLSHFSSLIWFIDAADDYTESLRSLLRVLGTVSLHNPGLHVDVFAHKSDAWDEFYRQDAFRQIQERTLTELEDHPSPGVQEMAGRVQFHLTSVYDHSVFEAMSRVVQRLVPTLAFLEQTLNYWSQTLDIPKCFLFDVPSRLYITTDASPVDAASHDVCCQYIENIEAFAGLFACVCLPPPSLPLSPSQFYPFPIPYSRTPNPLPRNISRPSPPNPQETPTYLASCSAKIAQENTVAYWQISKRLAIVALVQTQMYDTHRGAIEMNVKSLREALLRLEAHEERKRRPPPPAPAVPPPAVPPTAVSPPAPAPAELAPAPGIEPGIDGTHPSPAMGKPGTGSSKSENSSLRTPSVHLPERGKTDA